MARARGEMEQPPLRARREDEVVAQMGTRDGAPAALVVGPAVAEVHRRQLSVDRVLELVAVDDPSGAVAIDGLGVLPGDLEGR